MYSHIDSVGSVMFVERSSRHKETHAKKALNLISPLSITSWNFREPGFWIPTKGVLSHPKVDWPCQNLTLGSTREQPKGDPLILSFGGLVQDWVLCTPVTMLLDFCYISACVTWIPKTSRMTSCCGGRWMRTGGSKSTTCPHATWSTKLPRSLVWYTCNEL